MQLQRRGVDGLSHFVEQKVHGDRVVTSIIDRRDPGVPPGTRVCKQKRKPVAKTPASSALPRRHQELLASQVHDLEVRASGYELHRDPITQRANLCLLVGVSYDYEAM